MQELYFIPINKQLVKQNVTLIEKRSIPACQMQLHVSKVPHWQEIIQSS